MNRAHPHPIPGGSPLLRAATARRSRRHLISTALAALLGRALVLLPLVFILLAAISAIEARAQSPLSLTPRTTQNAEAFDPTFDPKTMSLTIVDDAALPILCQRAHARDGCAKRWVDAGGKVEGTCNIYIARRFLPESSPAFRALLAHEARHCRGWHHDGE